MSMERPDATGLRKSGKALEDSFFVRENARLLKKLKEKEAVAAKKQAFKDICNIENDELIEAFIELEIEPHELSALSLVPLIMVAWADGTIQQSERRAIIKAAEEYGVQKGTENHDLLENWLEVKPGPDLTNTWKHYANEVYVRLDNVVAAALKERLEDRTTAIAKAAGGFLGIGAISDSEQKVLDEIHSVFD
jgi:hypothetical protein